MGVTKYELDTIDETVVTLDTYNSDLNLVIDASKYSAQALTKEGFAFMWAGARATHGVKKGKVCFEVKIVEHLDVSHLPSDEPNPHVVRVGYSVDSSTLQLGEDPLSYGYGGTGKISTNCQFKDFGSPFKAGDCILAVVNMDSDPVEIGFAKNGNFLDWAYKIKKAELNGKALFPHVLTKNCSFEVNFGQREKPFFPLPNVVKNYVFIGCLPIDQRVAGARPPEKREDCEMIMMCGLPGAGKSVWAAEYSKKHPEKKFNVLGTNNIIDKMKVMGLPRKRNYHGRWDVLIQMATRCLNTMFSIGSKLRRNYILDQTNVYPTAQRRKMRNFDGFKRTAVVVVPTEEEYKRRCDKRDKEEGKEIPDAAVLEMKANFKIPEVADIFENVIFTELQRADAEKLVKKYNEEGKSAMGPPRKQFRPNEGGRDREFDSGRGNRDDSSYGKDDSRRFQGNARASERGYSNRGNRGGRGAFDRNFGNERSGYAERNRQSDIPENFGKQESYVGDRGDYAGNRREFGNYRDDGGNFGNRGFGDRESYDRGWGSYSERSDYGGFSGRESYESMPREGYENRGRGRGNFVGRRDAFNVQETSGRGDNYGTRQSYQDQDSGRYGHDYNAREDSGYQSYSDPSMGYNKGVQIDYSHGSGNVSVRGSSRGGFTGSTRGNYSFGSGRETYPEQKSSRGYGGNSRGDYSNRGSSDGRGYQRGNRGGSSRGNYQGSSNNNFTSGDRSSSIGMQGNYSKGYDYASGDRAANIDSQGNYSKSYAYTPGNYGDSNKYQSNSSNTASGYTSGSRGMETQPIQRPGASSMDSSKYGSARPSGPQTGWSAKTSQVPAAVSDSSYVTYKPASASASYSSGGSQSYSYQQNFGQSSQSAASYQNKQTYGYQQGVASNVTSQPWAGGTTSAVSNPSNYTLPSQSSWMQYGQQPVTSTQYYPQ